MNKWYINNLINELKESIAKDGTLDSLKRPFKCLGYIPGYNAYKGWLFQYDDIMVVLNDDSNGHYSYVGCVNQIIDELYAKAFPQENNF